MNEVIKALENKKYAILRNVFLSNKDFDGILLSQHFYDSKKVSKEKLDLLKYLDLKIQLYF